MTISIEDLVAIVGFTTLLTTASSAPLLYKLKTSLCKEITDLKIRLGILEKEESK